MVIRSISKHFFKIIFATILTISVCNFSYANNVVSDSVITAKIKSKTAVDKSISPLGISVTTNDAIVNIDGTVDSDTQASALIEMALSTQGVRDVDTTHLTVKRSHAPVTDTFITAKIKGLYLQKKLFSHSSIDSSAVHVETNNGIVYLSGSVKSQRILNRVVALTRSVSGVKDVESRLQIER